jgi:hypothetical protein
MWHPIGPFCPLIPPNSVFLYCFCRIYVSRLFPFIHGLCPSPHRVCVLKYVFSFFFQCTMPLLVLFNIIFLGFFFFFYCAVVGRISLYSFSRLPLIIPLSFVPDKSLNYIYPPSVTYFTWYGPSQCILSFPRC